jgi:NADH-quinone oxidoreductase subunit L
VKQTLLTLLPLTLLTGAILSFVIGRANKTIGAVIATTAAALSFLITLKLGSDFLATASLSSSRGYSPIEVTPFIWFEVGELKVSFTLLFDHLSSVMCYIITGIGTLIHIYSLGYMQDDAGKHRFFAYLNLFLFAMLLLVLGGNMLVMFVGWEGVGLCSYLLIGFWFTNPKYASAGRKAFVVNRIGDFGFLIGTFLLILYFNTADIGTILRLSTGTNINLSPFICSLIALMLFIAATGKSAQLPLYVWLPDAMAGPTPVSALIHAATMVTAGIYLLVRLHPIFQVAPDVSTLILIIAVVTSFISATIALVQTDIKKVLAYSTVSQLGFMFMAIGVGAYWVAIFHVMTHAFFKACLFLGAGSVIHGCHHEQDMRHLGGLWRKMPLTFITFFISTVAIAGVYPLAGYYSKHAIIEALHHRAPTFALDLSLMAEITAFLTAFYMGRALTLTFFGKFRGHHEPHESPLLMTMPLIILAILAIGGGFYFEERLPNLLRGVLPIPSASHHELSILEGLKGSLLGIVGLLSSIILFGTLLPAFPQLAKFEIGVKPLLSLFRGKYYLDELYELLIVKPLLAFSTFSHRVIDVGVIDGIVNGTGAVVTASGEVIRTTQSGQIRHYALYMFLFSILIVSFYFIL